GSGSGSGSGSSEVFAPRVEPGYAEAQGDDVLEAEELDVELSDEQKEALDSLARIIPDLKKLEIVYVYNDKSNDIWNVRLSQPYKKGKDPSFNGSAFLVFDSATGDLLNLSMNLPEWASTELPSVSFAKQQAEAFIKRLTGEQIEYKPGISSGSNGSVATNSEGVEMHWNNLSLGFHPYINGISFNSRATIVSVNSAGTVTGYARYDYDNWLDKKLDHDLFPTPTLATISLAEAEGIRAEEVSMELVYLLEGQGYLFQMFSPDQQKSPRMLYIPNNEPQYINAISGECQAFFGYTEQPIDMKLVGQGIELAANDRWEAENLLVEQFGVNVSGRSWEYQDNTAANMSLGDEEMNSFTWHLTSDGSGEQSDAPRYDELWEYPMLSGERSDTMEYNIISMIIAEPLYQGSINLVTITKTGKVVSYDSYFFDNSEERLDSNISIEAAQEIAIGFMEKVLPEKETDLKLFVYTFDDTQVVPDWVDETMLEESEQQWMLGGNQDANFIFDIWSQGVQVLGVQCVVSVSLVTGELTRVYMNIPDISQDLPDLRLAISHEFAKEEYLRNTPIELAYIWPEWNRFKTPAPLLVYTASPLYSLGYLVIDGLTGQLIFNDLTRAE
ncbi:MAG: hypothetical protein FWD21_01335, partial [Peptococcaceae bacterium]|nr:hypothetical protein [Peptococcaceae bacterium]